MPLVDTVPDMIRTRLAVTALTLIVATAAAGCGGDADPAAAPSASASTTTAAAPPTPNAPPTPDAYEPVKADFQLTVKVLKKKCFGSAGCNLTYRIAVAYNGPALDSSKTYEVTYDVKGGEDPQTGTLEVTGESASVPQEEMISTRRSKDKLTVAVTAVSEL